MVKKIIFKSILFTSILTLPLIAFFILDRYSSPFWGDPLLDLKYQAMKNTNEKYDVLFFGTSKTNRAIVPVLFDSLVGRNYKSFNLGCNGCMFDHQDYNMAQIVKANYNSNKTRYFFVELRSIDKGLSKDIRTIKRHHNRNFSRLILRIRYYFVSQEWQTIVSNIWLYIESKFKIGFLFDQLEYINGSFDDGKYAEIEEHRGYQPWGKRNGVYINKRDELVHRKFLDSKPNVLLEERKKIIRRNYNAKPRKSDIFLANIIGERIEYYEKMNIKLIFLKMPGVPFSPLFRLIPDSHKLDLSDPDKFDIFYSPNYKIDFGHLDYQGANIFTEMLANEFSKKIVAIE